MRWNRRVIRCGSIDSADVPVTPPIPLAVLQRRGTVAQAELLDEVTELVVARFRADLGDRPVRADNHALGHVEPVFIPVPRRRHAGVLFEQYAKHGAVDRRSGSKLSGRQRLAVMLVQAAERGLKKPRLLAAFLRPAAEAACQLAQHLRKQLIYSEAVRLALPRTAVVQDLRPLCAQRQNGVGKGCILQQRTDIAPKQRGREKLLRREIDTQRSRVALRRSGAVQVPRVDKQKVVRRQRQTPALNGVVKRALIDPCELHIAVPMERDMLSCGMAVALGIHRERKVVRKRRDMLVQLIVHRQIKFALHALAFRKWYSHSLAPLFPYPTTSLRSGKAKNNSFCLISDRIRFFGPVYWYHHRTKPIV